MSLSNRLRILADDFGLDFISVHVAYCKLRSFTGQPNTFVPITMIGLAAMDRWGVGYFRSLATETLSLSWFPLTCRSARFSIVITVIFLYLTAIPNLFLYDIVGGVYEQASPIYQNDGAFSINPLYSVLPKSLLTSFGYGTYRNIRQLARHQNEQHRGKLDEQLTRALIR